MPCGNSSGPATRPCICPATSRRPRWASKSIPGRVIHGTVDEGDKVKRGQVIAVLDTADLEAQGGVAEPS